MSFYGQVLYEFKKLFTHIQTKNSNKNEIPDNFSTSPALVEADSDWDTLNLEAGNQWIQFETDKDNKKISIYHNMPSKDNNSEDYTFFGILDGTPSAEISDQLTFGQTIQFNKGKKDKAGHIVIEETKEMKLPNLLLSIDNGDTTQDDYEVEKKEGNIFQFISNEMIHLLPIDDNSGIKIFHRENANIKPSNGHTSIYDAEDKRIDLANISIVGDIERDQIESLEPVQQLNTYDIIRVPIVTYDNSGHGLSYRYNYFKMPFTEQQQIQDQNSDDIKKLKEYTGILDEYKNTPVPSDIEEGNTLYGRINEINTFLDGKEANKLTDIEGSITTNTKNIGDLNADVFNNTLSSNKYITIFDSDDKKNLSKAIGSLETLSEAVYNSKLKLDKNYEKKKIKIEDISSLLSSLCSEVIDKHSDYISEIKEEQGNLQYIVGTIRKDNETLNSSINSLDERISNIESTLNNETNGLIQKIEDNTGAITLNEVGITDLTNRINAINYKNETARLENIIADLDNRITFLEENHF